MLLYCYFVKFGMVGRDPRAENDRNKWGESLCTEPRTTISSWVWLNGYDPPGPPVTWPHKLDRFILVISITACQYYSSNILNIITNDHEIRSGLVLWSLHVSFMSWNPKSLIHSSEGSLMVVVVWSSVQKVNGPSD